MPINFSKSQTTTVENTAQITELEVPEVIKNYDIVEDRKSMNQLVGSKEVDDLASTIVLDDPNTIVLFGQEAADQIAQASDTVLRSINMDKFENSSKLLKSLDGIMSKFDLDEIKNENQGFLQKLFGNAKKQLAKLLEKYHTMGDEVDKIYIELKKYEADIQKSNKYLEQMFETNVNTYHELVKYILAGEQGCEELRQYIDQKEMELQNGDQSVMLELDGLKQSLNLLEQRTQDLRTAESVALQSIPMIKVMEFSNMNIVRKINSAFIITLPIFKQALAQAMMLKQQKIQAEALSALDKRTNEMLLKNAQNTVNQAKLTAQMTSSSSIKADTLEKTWDIIVNGIKETQKIQEETAKNRIQDKEKLLRIKENYIKTFGGVESNISPNTANTKIIN